MISLIKAMFVPAHLKATTNWIMEPTGYTVSPVMSLLEVLFQPFMQTACVCIYPLRNGTRNGSAAASGPDYDLSYQAANPK